MSSYIDFCLDTSGLFFNPLEQWKPYEEFPEYFLPDPAGFSKGITTFLTLLKQNWVAIKS
jgi:hypothetical protein